MSGREVGEIEEEWMNFKMSIGEVSREICGVKRVGGRSRRKGSEWWSKELEVQVKKKKEAYVRYLGVKSRETWEEYKSLRNEIKREIRIAKERATERWSRKIVENYRERKKMFWKEVNKIR